MARAVIATGYFLAFTCLGMLLFLFLIGAGYV
jgi:hypothetical protein